jgi:glycosyltransferase involved in cell wall biosynthesis
VIISSGQPSLNPRLVKEADTLSAVGYDVTVLYAYWNNWGTRYDREILPLSKWKAICIGGDPDRRRFTWFLSRMIHKTARQRLQKNDRFEVLAEKAIARSSYFLIKKASEIGADLYIAHNLGALPAAAKAAASHNKPYGFDAEDFHRQEVNDDTGSMHFKLCSFIEDKYLPGAAYITASSPLIAERYEQLYDREILTLKNVFPKTHNILPLDNRGPLKLFWFSQTIGPNRGLELIIESLGICKADFELHLLGQPSGDYAEQLLQLANKKGINAKKIHFHAPVKGEDIFKMAPQFDIGLASEPGFCLNNNIALSNKIFTYIQCGLAVAASNTPAQCGLQNEYPKTGKLYASAQQLADIFDFYDQNREQLYQTKLDAYQTGQEELNWDIEGQKFLQLIKTTLEK